MYIVEGNIGAGKSTFLSLVKEHISAIDVVPEPLHTWQSEEHGLSLLHNFYQDPQRWGFSMETFTMASRVIEHLKDQEHINSNRLMERSIFSGHYCFAKNSYESGFLTTFEWNVYTSWFNLLIPSKCALPSGFIYLRVSPEIAYERLKKRSRSGEEQIPLAYLQQLHACHDKFLLEKKEILPALAQVPVLVLDCDQEFEREPKLLAKHLKSLCTFMQLPIDTIKPIKAI